MGPRIVLYGVLNELETRKADRIEREVVRSSGVGEGDRFRCRIIERCKPLAENAACFLVPLQVNSSESAGAVVMIEIYGEFLVSRFCLQRSRCSSHHHLHHIRLPLAVGVFHISPRTKQALFLAAPERNSDGSARLQAKLLDNADSLQGCRRTGTVIGSSRACVP